MSEIKNIGWGFMVPNIPSVTIWWHRL